MKFLELSILAFIAFYIQAPVQAQNIKINQGSGAGWSTGSSGCVLNINGVISSILSSDQSPRYEFDLSAMRTRDLAICDDSMEISAATMIDILQIIANRYPTCFVLTVDHENRKLSLAPGPDLVFLQSTHVETSTYVVEGGPQFSLETNNSRRERYFCPYDLTHAAPWAKQAFTGREIRSR